MIKTTQSREVTFVAPSLEDAVFMAPFMSMLKQAVAYNKLVSEYRNLEGEEKAAFEKEHPEVRSYYDTSIQFGDAETIEHFYDILSEIGFVSVDAPKKNKRK